MSINRHREKLTYKNIDYYFPLLQKRLLIADIAAEYFSRIFLDLGCGEMPYKSIITQNASIEKYIGIDIENQHYQQNVKPNMYWDGQKIPLKSNTVNSAMLIEVLEHVPQPQLLLNELNRVLTPGGICLISVPFLWTLHDAPYDEYRYTPFALKRLVTTAQFEVLRMEAFGGWHASMASMIALYIRRGIQPSRCQKLLSKIALPIIKHLMKKDANNPKDTFKSGDMITGIWCVIKKNKL